MGAEVFQFNDYVHESALDDFKNMASRYWPGAVTIVVPISDKGKSFLSIGNFTLGLRIPNSTMAKTLIKESGPLLTQVQISQEDRHLLQKTFRLTY